jgi:hypothetical protein
VAEKLMGNWARGYAINRKAVWASFIVFLLLVAFIAMGGMQSVNFGGQGKILALPVLIAIFIPLHVYTSGVEANRKLGKSESSDGS